jgi:EAL domain-containing protein (putative c-di-GMP-specific phosphodiesterase class I)
VHLVNSSGEVGARIFIEGVETQEERERNTSSSNNLTVSEIVPAGASYMVVATIGSIETFYELR